MVLSPFRLSLCVAVALLSTIIPPGWTESAPQNAASAPPISQEQPTTATKGKHKPSIPAGKLKTEPTDSESVRLLDEINHLHWEAAPVQGQSDDTQKISLEKIFKETLANSIPVRQAELKVKDAETEAKAKDPGLFGLFMPLLDWGALKQASENNIQAAKAHLMAVRQKALLDSAKMHADLLRAFMNKYLAFQAIAQGKLQLTAEQQRFTAGETTHFDVTETQMALIDRYGKYLNADNAYHMASMLLANQIGKGTGETLIPEDSILQDGSASVQMLSLLPSDLTLEKILKAARTRPDIQELQLRKSALQNLIKASSGADRQRKESELNQMELEEQKALEGSAVMAEKAFSDYHLAGKNLELAQQSYNLAAQMLHQLEVSREAGFSSSKDVLDGQVVAAQAKTSLIGAQVAYNLSQIQLLYEMGLLGEESTTHPLVLPNSL